MKTKPTYRDSLVFADLTRDGAAKVLRHWRALGYEVGRQIYSRRLRQYYLGTDFRNAEFVVFA